MPATARGSKPTGVSTEKRPPTLSGITNVSYPSLSASVLRAPLALSVIATMRSLASALPTCSSSKAFRIRKAIAGSVVVPLLEILIIPKLLSFRNSVNSTK